MLRNERKIYRMELYAITGKPGMYCNLRFRQPKAMSYRITTLWNTGQGTKEFGCLSHETAGKLGATRGVNTNLVDLCARPKDSGKSALKRVDKTSMWNDRSAYGGVARQTTLPERGCSRCF